jgi:hypothetical protein
MNQNDPKKTQTDGVEGEGSYEATHNYDAGLKASIAEGKTEELAKKAEKALDGPEGKALRDAEERGKKGPTATPGPAKR